MHLKIPKRRRLGRKREGKDGCVRNSMYNHRVEMHRDGGSTSGFNRIAPRTGPVVTPCRYSLRHSDRQERASSRVLVVIIARKSLSHRRLTPLRNENFLSGFDRSRQFFEATVDFYRARGTRVKFYSY